MSSEEETHFDQVNGYEQVVLGVLLLENSPENFASVSKMVKPGTFYSKAHQLIYAAIERLWQKGEAVDLLTVTDNLRNRSIKLADGKEVTELQHVGGPAYVSELSARIGSAANIEVHAAYVYKYWMLRQLVGIGKQLTQASQPGKETDPYQAAADGMQEIKDLLEDAVGSKMTSLHDATEQVIMDLDDASVNGKQLGFATGWMGIDYYMGGLMPGHTYVLAARAKTGKTTAAMQLARNLATGVKREDGAQQRELHVAYYSLEMSAKDLARRNLAVSTDIYQNKLRDVQLDSDDFTLLRTQGMEKAGIPIRIWDEMGARLDPEQLFGMCLQLHAKGELDVVIIDYLQLMHDSKYHARRDLEVASLSLKLKRIAMRLQIPVIFLSQLNRKSDDVAQITDQETGSTYKPAPTEVNLRESGAIEQDVSGAIMLWRPEPESWELASQDPRRYAYLGWTVPIAREASGYRQDNPKRRDPETELWLKLSTGEVVEGHEPEANGRNRWPKNDAEGEDDAPVKSPF